MVCNTLISFSSSGGVCNGFLSRITKSARFPSDVYKRQAFYIPVGPAKCFPIQHMVNVLAAVMLGPAYGVIMAFITSLLRVILGMGSLLAFPGSMIGALCAGLLYKAFPKIGYAVLGEVVGTGVLGALAAYPVAVFLMGQASALFAFVIPFSVSTLGGSLLSILILLALKKTRLLERI